MQQLEELYAYIARVVSPLVANRYTNAIVTYCETLQTFPLRGACRDDIRPGLRITNYKGRAVIAFEVSRERVNVIGIFHGGQDYDTTLNPPESDISQ